MESCFSKSYVLNSQQDHFGITQIISSSIFWHHIIHLIRFAFKVLLFYASRLLRSKWSSYQTMHSKRSFFKCFTLQIFLLLHSFICKNAGSFIWPLDWFFYSLKIGLKNSNILLFFRSIIWPYLKHSFIGWKKGWMKYYGPSFIKLSKQIPSTKTSMWSQSLRSMTIVDREKIDILLSFTTRIHNVWKVKSDFYNESYVATSLLLRLTVRTNNIKRT